MGDIPVLSIKLLGQLGRVFAVLSHESNISGTDEALPS